MTLRTTTQRQVSIPTIAIPKQRPAFLDILSISSFRYLWLGNGLSVLAAGWVAWMLIRRFPELRESLIQSDPDYLVYVAKLGSTEQANRTAQELKTLEIDSYLIRRDDVGPILSVGVFSQEARAERLQERLHKLGYEVVLEALERTQTVFELTGHVLIDSEDYSTSTANCASIAQGR